ncbi:Os01g0723075 [Oryza sativa Japonica Group]|uniref:Os01g0723075 protein n=1 Tax=Oryza sativa subsp. japonica TaxID=39947 RepID=A0A0P0V7L3_ORYSJ|nr:Os01g0723075 [Oryza sativa Japonica Group]
MRGTAADLQWPLRPLALFSTDEKGSEEAEARRARLLVPAQPRLCLDSPAHRRRLQRRRRRHGAADTQCHHVHPPPWQAQLARSAGAAILLLDEHEGGGLNSGRWKARFARATVLRRGV